MTNEKSGNEKTMECGCATTHIQSFGGQTPCQSANQPKNLQMANQSGSALTHWPIQIRLIPAHAPFLKNCDLLIVADCTAASVADLHNRYLAGKVMMMGCPKFDDAQNYVERFAEIIDNCDLRSLTILIMEVPCCSAMNVIVKQAMDKAGKTVPVEQITISTKGEELERICW